MSKKTHFTTVTALPAGITRQTVLDTLHSHTEMIDLNPLVTDRHPIRPPPAASAEEAHCQWYSISDKISYLPGVTGSLTFMGCFHDLPDGLQTHILAPMGLDMKGRWTLGGSLPGEPRQTQEFGLGLPKQGLWLKEDVEMKCNFAMTRFVRKTTEKAHSTLVARLIEKSHIKEGEAYNERLEGASFVSSSSASRNSGGIPPPGYDHHHSHPSISPMPTGGTMSSMTTAPSPRLSGYSQDGTSGTPYAPPAPHPAYTHQQLQQQAQAPATYPADTKHPYDPNTAFQQQAYPPDTKQPLPQNPALHQQQQQQPHYTQHQAHGHSSYDGHSRPDPSLYPPPLQYSPRPQQGEQPQQPSQPQHQPQHQQQQQQQQRGSVESPMSPPPLSTSNLNKPLTVGQSEFAVELPGGEARTPMELEGGGGGR